MSLLIPPPSVKYDHITSASFHQINLALDSKIRFMMHTTPKHFAYDTQILMPDIKNCWKLNVRRPILDAWQLNQTVSETQITLQH